MLNTSFLYIESFYLIISFSFFFVGFLQVVFIENKNVLTLLVASELMFLGLNLNFIYLYLFWNFMESLVFSISLIAVSAAEVAIGLSLSILCVKLNKTTELIKFNKLKL